MIYQSTVSKKFKTLIDAYYYFFDHKLKNTTIIVGLIGALILFVGVVIGGKFQITQQYATSNILELQNNQIMKIGDVEYRVSVEELKK